MIVLDASALVDVVLDQPARGSVLDHLNQPTIAPVHQLAEVLSTVARFVRTDEITTDVARGALEEARELEQAHVMPTEEHLQRALELQERIRVGDGLYVALAEEHRCPLLTTDRRLAGAQPPCEVILVET
jgi:predicted nucleic acid-binding protein